RAARDDLVQDLVERHDPAAELSPERHLQDEERSRELARHDDLLVAELVERERVVRDDHGAVSGAHARPVRKQHIAVVYERIRRERHRSDLEPSLERPFVERLDVGYDRLELVPARVDRPGGEAPEHERVVWIGAEADAHEHGCELSTMRYFARPKNHASSGFSNSWRVNGRRCSPCPSASETVRSSSSAPFAFSRASSSS